MTHVVVHAAEHATGNVRREQVEARNAALQCGAARRAS